MGCGGEASAPDWHVTAASSHESGEGVPVIQKYVPADDLS